MQMPRTLIAVAMVAIAAASAQPVAAQGGLMGKLKQKAKQRVEQKTDEAADKAVDKADQTVTCAVTDTACQEKAKAEGKTVTTTEAAGSAAGASADAAANPGEGAWVNFDFVPGTRAIYANDFSKDNVGDFPRRLEFVDGNMEVAGLKDGSRMLRSTTWSTFAIVLPEELPERFTIEFDANGGNLGQWLNFSFSEDPADVVRFRLLGGKGVAGVFGDKHQTQGETARPIGDTEIYRGRIMADGKYVKVYMNDTRTANIPNADLGRSKRILIEFPGLVESPALIGNISIMAGGRKLYDAIAESGRVATQGIFFDTGSDRVRPESTPTLKEIAEMLKEHADLRLAIEGHTDNVGSAASNQTLSEKRAAAVKETLVSHFGVDASRLETKGLGATKPVAPNDTPEGRQTNRRVELVKI